MTKLGEWLFCLTLFVSVWLGVIFDYTPLRVSESNRLWVYAFPLILVALFGVFSLFTIIYRVLTFNNCEKAAEELRAELDEARKDLTAKGFKFR